MFFYIILKWIFILSKLNIQEKLYYLSPLSLNLLSQDSNQILDDLLWEEARFDPRHNTWD
jgi:hypothetical protein